MELDGVDFHRINRSTIVAIDFVGAVSNKGWILLKYNCEVNLKVSAGRHKVLMDKLKNCT